MEFRSKPGMEPVFGLSERLLFGVVFAGVSFSASDAVSLSSVLSEALPSNISPQGMFPISGKVKPSPNCDISGICVLPVCLLPQDRFITVSEEAKLSPNGSLVGVSVLSSVFGCTLRFPFSEFPRDCFPKDVSPAGFSLRLPDSDLSPRSPPGKPLKPPPLPPPKPPMSDTVISLPSIRAELSAD